jgi:hypothetical protein
VPMMTSRLSRGFFMHAVWVDGSGTSPWVLWGLALELICPRSRLRIYIRAGASVQFVRFCLPNYPWEGLRC